MTLHMLRPSALARPLLQSGKGKASHVAIQRRAFIVGPRAMYANPSPSATAAAISSNPSFPSLHSFTEEENLLRDTVRKFSQEVVEPKVRQMDEAEKMDPEIIKGLFEQGVRLMMVLLFPASG